jgi:hypothetical protein
VVNDLPRKNVLFSKSTDGKLFRPEFIVLHRLFPPHCLFGHIEKDRCQPAVTSGEDSLE